MASFAGIGDKIVQSMSTTTSYPARAADAENETTKRHKTRRFLTVVSACKPTAGKPTKGFACPSSTSFILSPARAHNFSTPTDFGAF